MDVSSTMPSPEAAVMAAVDMKSASTQQEAAILTFKKALDAHKAQAADMLKMVSSGSVGRNVNTYG